MKIVFFGTGEFAVPALEAVRNHVTLVVTQPDRPSGRGMKLRSSPVKNKAIELGLPVETPEKARASEFIERIREMHPDFLLVASYGQILPQSLLDAARQGGINLHGSILPKYRGAAPIPRAILEGERETGVTLMQMDKGMDTGDIIRIARTPIDPVETYGALQNRLALIGATMLLEMMPQLQSGQYQREPQPTDGASVAAKVRKEEAEITFQMPLREAYNRFRAFTPAPGSFLMTRFGRLRLTRLSIEEKEPSDSSEPGTIAMPNWVAFKDGWLNLLEIQPEGKKRMSGQDFFNGARLRTGDSLNHGST